MLSWKSQICYEMAGWLFPMKKETHKKMETISWVTSILPNIKNIPQESIKWYKEIFPPKKSHKNLKNM